MQAPVVGGNAGGPPEWAGRRDRERTKVAFINGKSEVITAQSGRVRIELCGDMKMPPPVIVIDR